MFKAIVFPKNLLTFAISLVIYCCVNSTAHSQSVVTQTGVTRVVVDAGHGGLDPGSVGKNSLEKNLNLAVALLVGKMITDSFPSVEVFYTRKTDVAVALDERSRIANKHNADLFISIHTNSVNKSSVKGTETFVMGIDRSAANMEVAKRENAVITYEDDYTSKYEGYDPNSPESFIIFSLMQNAYLDQSLQMAALVQEEFGTYPIKANRGVKQGPFLVLWRTAMPSILVEMGFLSNPEDEKTLLSKDGQARIASAIFRAFKNYKAYYDRQAELAGNAVPAAKPASGLTAKTPATVTPAPEKQPAATPEVRQSTTPATMTVQERTLYSALEEKPQEPLVATPATVPDNTVVATTVTETEQAKPAGAKRSYRVQIMASRVKLPTNAKEFVAFKDVKAIPADGWYKYTTGNFDTLEEAQKYCNEDVRKKIKDAFVVCVEDEKIVPLKK